MTMQPCAPADGANFSETDDPAEKNAISALLKSNSSRSSTSSIAPAKGTVFPADRLLASGKSCCTGNWRCSSTRIMFSPTAPVAPTTAILKRFCILEKMMKNHDFCPNSANRSQITDKANHFAMIVCYCCNVALLA